MRRRLQEGVNLADLAGESGASPGQISRGYQEALEGLESVFGQSQRREQRAVTRVVAARETRIRELQAVVTDGVLIRGQQIMTPAYHVASSQRAIVPVQLGHNQRMTTMHRMHNHPRTSSSQQTTGLTIHWASQYDVLTRLLGLGVNRANSRMVVEMAKIKPGDKVLDVGCGTGNLTLTARTYVGATGSVHGIDASPEMIAVARDKSRRSGSDAVFEVGLIERIAYPDATFDVIISRLVMHHLPEDLKRQGLAEIYRVLKPGGHLFLADFQLPANPILAHLMAALVGHRMIHSNVWRMAPLLTEAGFRDVTSGPTRSAFLGYVGGMKPAA